MESMGTSQ